MVINYQRSEGTRGVVVDRCETWMAKILAYYCYKDWKLLSDTI